jgi:hypothetical protein
MNKNIILNTKEVLYNILRLICLYSVSKELVLFKDLRKQKMTEVLLKGLNERENLEIIISSLSGLVNCCVSD